MLETVILAFGLSADVFAASIALGSSYAFPLLLKIGVAICYGLLGAFAPLAGFLIGKALLPSLEKFSPWVTFSILGLLGAQTIWAGLKGTTLEKYARPPSLGAISWAGLATSIDNIAVGLALPFISHDIPVALGAIGSATCLMTFIGLGIGNRMGILFGKCAELLEGAGLVLIGANILYRHLKDGG